MPGTNTNPFDYTRTESSRAAGVSSFQLGVVVDRDLDNDMLGVELRGGEEPDDPYPIAVPESMAAPPTDSLVVVGSDDGERRFLAATINGSTSDVGVDVEDDGSVTVSGATAINFADNLDVADDGDGTVTVDASGGGGSSVSDNYAHIAAFSGGAAVHQPNSNYPFNTVQGYRGDILRGVLEIGYDADNGRFFTRNQDDNKVHEYSDSPNNDHLFTSQQSTNPFSDSINSIAYDPTNQNVVVTDTVGNVKSLNASDLSENWSKDIGTEILTLDIASNGDIYFAFDNGDLKHYDSDGNQQNTASETSLWPLAVATDGSVFVGDDSDNKLVKYDSSLTRQWDVSLTTIVNQPTTINATFSGAVIVGGEWGLVKYDTDGNKQWGWETEFTLYGVGATPEGKVYAVRQGRNTKDFVEVRDESDGSLTYRYNPHQDFAIISYNMVLAPRAGAYPSKW